MRTIESLIVTDVHTKDVTEEIMKQNVRDTSHFSWIQQLRHYTAMEAQPTKPTRRGTPGEKVQQLEIKVSMINSTRLYGFEYQGS